MNLFQSIFDKICEPDPKSVPNDVKRKLCCKRNQNLLGVQLIMVALLTLNAVFIKPLPTFTDYWFVGIFSCLLIVFCLTCRSRPLFFQICYTFVITFYGVIALYFDKKGIFTCWDSIQLAPVLMLYFSGYGIPFAIEVGVQLLFLATIYKEQMVIAMNSSEGDKIVEKMTSSLLFTSVLRTVVVYHLSLHIKKDFQQELQLAENKKRELEVQKNFILSFSHEIRNLINSLTGNIQLSLLEKAISKVKTHLEDAEVGAGMLIQLVNNILDTGNLELGELDVNCSNQAIHSTLEKMWRMCAYLLKTKNLKGKFRILKNLPRNLRLDHERFLQVLINLVVNAVKFTDKGSIDIKLEWIPNVAQVTQDSFFPLPFDDENEGIFEKDQAFSFLSDDFAVVGLDKKRWSLERYNTLQGCGPGLLKVSVTDTGCGVLSENLPKVFEKFSDNIFGDGVSNRLGTTIGLYITKELCSKMGGDIKVFSKLNKGTSFVACIPAEQIFMKTIQDLSVGTLSTLPEEIKLKAMIVDDLNFNIIVLTNYLQRMKIEISNTAADGLEAYTKYVKSVEEGNRPDIITMDVEMPVADGRKATQMIRQYERENHLEPCFIIMISGNVCESEISECLWQDGKMLANLFLKKPALFEDVFRVITDRFSFGSQSDISTTCF